MNIGEAVAIFKNIRSDKYSIEEKGWAIHSVLTMPTHNSISKAEILDVMMWLWHEHWEMTGAVDVLNLEGR